MIDGISDTQLHRYLTLRQRCDAQIKNIQSLSSLLTTFTQCDYHFGRRGSRACAYDDIEQRVDNFRTTR